MEKRDGYYWVQMEYMSVWVVGLYRKVNGRALWFLPGLAEPLETAQFKFVSEWPISHPNEMQGASRIWVPDSVAP